MELFLGSAHPHRYRLSLIKTVLGTPSFTVSLLVIAAEVDLGATVTLRGRKLAVFSLASLRQISNNDLLHYHTTQYSRLTIQYLQLFRGVPFTHHS